MYFNSVIKKYQSKFVGCALANPAEDGSGVKQLGQLVLEVFSKCHNLQKWCLCLKILAYTVLFDSRMVIELFDLIRNYGHLVKRY